MERFYSKVEKIENGCWNWMSALRGKSGYGAFKVNGKCVDAHRFSFMLNKGDIPNGLYVCHKCDNRKCVNPEHLFLGSAKDNHQDGMNKGRIVPPANEQLKKHPSLGAYMRGCRCEECRELQRLRSVKYRTK